MLNFFVEIVLYIDLTGIFVQAISRMEWESEAQEELQQLSIQTREEVLQHLVKEGSLPRVAANIRWKKWWKPVAMRVIWCVQSRDARDEALLTFLNLSKHQKVQELLHYRRNGELS